MDGLIAEYVAEAIDDLDAMTGDACVVFVFDLHDGDRSATAAGLQMAEFLHIRVDAFPCLVIGDAFHAPIENGYWLLAAEGAG